MRYGHVAGILLFAIAPGCGQSHEESDVHGSSAAVETPGACTPVSPTGSQLLDSLRSRYQYALPPSPGGLMLSPKEAGSNKQSLIGPSQVSCFVQNAVSFRPLFDPTAEPNLSLPRLANGLISMISATHQIELSLPGALGIIGEVADGYVLFPDALPNHGHVIHRATRGGVEVFVAFEQAPTLPQLDYEANFGVGIAGLRLVGNALEALSADGIPRWRLSPPVISSEGGQTYPVILSLVGCSADNDPAPPWGRPVVAPGAKPCKLRLSWQNAAGITYPALLDPGWQTTGSMSQARQNHSATRFSDGRVLVAGGDAFPMGFLSSAEIWDPATRTWAMTANMPTVAEAGATRAGRGLHTANLLPDGRVLIVGGADETLRRSLASALIFSPKSGSWMVTGAMKNSRVQHAATLLDSGSLLISGGFDSWAGTEVAEAEIFALNAFAEAGSAQPRRWHAASVLADGRVVVSGGYNTVGPQPVLRSTDVFNPVNRSWTPGPNLAFARLRHSQTTLTDGRLLVVGGDSAPEGPTLASVELYAGMSWFSGPAMVAARSDHSALRLPDGRVLVVGGSTTDASTELFVPATNSWRVAGTLVQARSHAPAVLITPPLVDTTSALIEGGIGEFGSGFQTLASAELFSPAGLPCTSAADCGSQGYCVDGVCCDNACNGGAPNDCLACSVAAGASGDGICRPLTNGIVCGVSGSNGVCSSGFCLVTCPTGFADCDGNAANGCETNTQSNSAHCGGCGKVCSQTCTQGACCPSGHGDCDGNSANGCETSIVNNQNACGGCGVVCQVVHSTDPNLCSWKECSPSCSFGWGNCDGNGANGCEQDLLSPNHCGTCNVACSSNHATPQCGSTAQGIKCVGACDVDWVDCNGNKTADGCETPAMNACGGCSPFFVCSPNHIARSCHTGQCDGACDPGYADCNADKRSDGCETPTTELLNCGACGHQCSTSTMDAVACNGGSCTGTCKPGFKDCNESPDTDGCETNVNGDPDHCGSCSTVCSSNHTAYRACLAGTCKFTCQPGFVDCNGNPADGCEKSANDPDFCAVCSCSDGNGCTNDTCVPGSGCVHQAFPSCGDGICSVGEDGCSCPADCVDTDKDGIPDTWETNGVDTNCDGVADYPLVGANPAVQDVFLEIDYMFDPHSDRRPTAQEISDLIAPFSAQGINLHVEVDEALPLVDTTTLGPPSSSCSFNSSNSVNYYDIRQIHLDPKRRGVYRYMVASNRWNYGGVGCTTYAGGGITGGSIGSIIAVGVKQDFSSSATGPYFHELGHTLGLDHGGGDAIAAKPNYTSAMSRGFSMLANPPLPQDYSRQHLLNLDEANLSEAAGIGSPVPVNLSWSCPPKCHEKLSDCASQSFGGCSDSGNPKAIILCQGWGDASSVTTGPVDWNCNGATGDASGFQQNLTGICRDESLCDQTTTPLPGHADWVETVKQKICMNGTGWGAYIPLNNVPLDEAAATVPGLGGANLNAALRSVTIELDRGEITLGDSGTVAVTILSTPEFDPNIVDPTSVALSLASSVYSHMIEVNGDSVPDLVIGFPISELNLIPASSVVHLTAGTAVGFRIQGSAPVVVRGAPHPVPPVARCGSPILAAGKDCKVNASINALSTDANGDQLQFKQSPPGPYRLGTTGVKLSVNDGHYTETCQAHVSVVDRSPPVLDCPALRTVECTNNYHAHVQPVVQVEDNCDHHLAVTCEPAEGAIAPLGDSIVRCRADDKAGNKGNCEYLLRVQDTQPPEIVTRAPRIVDVGRDEETFDFQIAHCIEEATDRCNGPVDVETHGRITGIEWIPNVEDPKHGTSAKLQAARQRFADAGCSLLTFVPPSRAKLPVGRNVVGLGGAYRVRVAIRDASGNERESSCLVDVRDHHSHGHHVGPLDCTAKDSHCISLEELCR